MLKYRSCRSEGVIFVLFLLLTSIITFIPIIDIPVVEAEGENWLSGWNYRKAHTIANASGASTNYQTLIKVYYGAGTDGNEIILQVSAGKVYLNSECETDFSDIRFTDDDGNTLLDYWLENKTDSSAAIFWVEVADNLNDTDQTIYIYYGNAIVSSVSNGTATFPFFDDFSSGTIEGGEGDNYTATITSMTRDEDAYVYRDFGVANFNALDIDFEANITAGSSGILGILALANGVNDLANLASPAVNVILHESGGTKKIWLNRGPQTAYDDYVAVFNTMYYMTLNRTAGNDQIDLYIYDDSARTNFLDKLSVAGFGTATYRYLYAVCSWDSNQPTRVLSATAGNISIDGGVVENLAFDYTEIDPNNRITGFTSTSQTRVDSSLWVEEYANAIVDEVTGIVHVVGTTTNKHGIIYGVPLYMSGMIRWNISDHLATTTNSGNAGGTYPNIDSVGRDIFYWCTYHTDYSQARLRINDDVIAESDQEGTDQVGIIDTYFKEGFGMVVKDGIVKVNETNAALTIPAGLRPWMGVYQPNDGYMESDYVFVREFVISEPVHGAWGSLESENEAPTVTNPSFTDITSADNDGAQIDVNTEYWVSYTIGDVNTLVDLNIVTFVIWGPSSTLEGSDSESDHYTFTYTQATDTWKEVGPDAGDSHLISSNCSDPPNQEEISGTFRLAFKLGKIAEYTATALWTVTMTVVDDNTLEDSDETLTFGVTFYSEIVATDSIHTWTGLYAGSVDVELDDDADIDIMVTANAIFDVEVKGSGDLIDGVNIIGLENIEVHKDTLGSAIALTESYSDIVGLTSQVAGLGLTKSFKLWISVPIPKLTGSYTYTLYVQATRS